MRRKKIRSVIFTSSVAVYGFTHDNANETSQTKPFNFYGESKLEAEKLFANWYKNNNLNKNLNFIDYYIKLRLYSLNYLLKLR